MQLVDLRRNAKQRAGLNVNDAFVVDAVITDFVNAAIRQVAMMQDWDWNYSSETITSVVDQPAYARAADCRKTDRVIDIADAGLLEQISKKQAVRYLPEASTLRGVIPRFWYVEGGQLILIPTPTSVRTYRHVYVAAEPTLSADADVPDIPDWAIDLVIVKAALMITARTDNTSQHQLLEREEKDLLEALADEARRARGSAIPQTRRDWAMR